ncbi:IST1 [Candida oxycetoniae]|uniref:IST1 n=1 Tax=Candida oxycetoniae TaxID=497107 RepID=A0AAI9WVT5_9ASCO|nr:IST1 [Candida oxycetoniae]KAI3402575.2 IST1 [Candida oxycetoniae]
MARPVPPPQLNPLRLKTALKMALSKLKFIQEKKLAMTKQQRRNLAELLRQGKESSARIRVENIIRDDIYVELLEYLELYCELILARLSILLDRSTCDSSLLEAVQSVIYAASHTELRELTTIRDMLTYKYGVEFGKEALENSGGYVPDKITRRCEIDPPSMDLVDMYLCEIARAYSVPYSGLPVVEEEEEEEKGEKGDDNDDSGGGGGGGVGEKNDMAKKENVKESPIAELAKKSEKLFISDSPGGASSKVTKSNSKTKEGDDFDLLKARFAALKSTPK